MSACETCWNAAYIKSRFLGGHQADHYTAELAAHPEHADTGEKEPA